MIHRLLIGWLCAWALFGPGARAEEPLTRQQASQALRAAVDFFHHEVSASGAYLWRYRHDLARGEGEGRGSATTAWVQPPGTPTVGGALLFAYQATGDDHYLQAARATAVALTRGQLESGGWDYRIEFAPRDRRKYTYRIDNTGGRRNTTTLDDNTTQAALRYLMRVDQALGFEDREIHEAAEYALTRLLAAQYPNGAWPQRFDKPPDPAQHPVVKANYPATWPREHPRKDYRSYYTFNDNTIADMIDTLFEAARIYEDSRYSAAAGKAGDFIILAQMPSPQPAWAQQYNAAMQPAWARRFEPPAITGGESQGVLRTLLSLYRETGDRKYLQPIPAALAYLKSSELPDGRLARFYEMQTNRPLYFTKKYELTYKDDDLPTHYGFQVGSRLDAIQNAYDELCQADPALPTRATTRTYRLTGALQRQAREAVSAQDEHGAWVEEGRLRSYGENDPTRRVIETRTFVRHVETLSKFIAASQ